MTQEEKALLLKDLCARLPYGVKVLNTTYRDPEIHTLFGRVSEEEFSMKETYKQVGGEDYRVVKDNVHHTGNIETIKPYLRPMSSMTEEERDEYTETFDITNQEVDDYDVFQVRVVDWLHKHHFDVRGLIERGLANVAPNDMYKLKE